MKRYALWIDGAEIPAVSGQWHTVIAPDGTHATYAVAQGGFDDVQAAVSAAYRMFPSWREHRPSERGRTLAAIGAALRADLDSLVARTAEETGKSVRTVTSEVQRSAACFEFFADLVDLPSGEIMDLGSGRHAFMRREPFGVIGTLTDSDSILCHAARVLAPALAVGNTVVLNPSAAGTAGALYLARAAQACGLPNGVLNVVTGTGAAVQEAIIGHPHVHKVSFSGTARAARAIGAVTADRLLPVSLEVSGRCPTVVFADGALDRALPAAVDSFIGDPAQSPCASARLIIEESVHDEFVAAVKASVEKTSHQNHTAKPLLPSAAQLARTQGSFREAEQEGAKLVLGGISDGDGAPSPTIYTNVIPEMRIALDDLCVPVLSVMRFRHTDEAVELVNDVENCTGASVWTADPARAHFLSTVLNASHMYINAQRTRAEEGTLAGGTDTGLWTRESGIEALHQYTRSKFVTVELGYSFSY